MDPLEERVSTLEERSDKILQLLQQAVNTFFALRERIDDLEGRLRAHTLITTAVLQLSGRSDPEGFRTILSLLELTERDIERGQENEATIRELREILRTLRTIAAADRA
jgi:hypothetical protein